MKTLIITLFLILFFFYPYPALAGDEHELGTFLSIGLAADWEAIDYYGFGYASFEASIGREISPGNVVLITGEFDPHYVSYSDDKIAEEIGNRWSIGPEYRRYWGIDDYPAYFYFGSRLFYGFEENVEVSTRFNEPVAEFKIKKAGIELVLGIEYQFTRNAFFGIHARPLQLSYFSKRNIVGSSELEAGWAMISTYQFATIVVGFYL